MDGYGFAGGGGFAVLTPTTGGAEWWLSQQNQAVASEDQVHRVARYVEPILPEVGCLEALELFQSCHQIFALPVVERGGRPLGLINRMQMIELFSRPFARELNQRKRAADFVHTQTLFAEHDSHVDDLVERIGRVDRPELLTGFVVTEAGRYAGVGTLHELLHQVTRRKQAHLYQLAHFDALTGLPNRLLFHERLENACCRAQRNDSGLALLFLDLDGFKLINDTLGHSAGDHLLQVIAQRLQQVIRRGDTLARLGGDEFTLILPDITDTEALEKVCRDLLAAIAAPVQWRNERLSVTGSLGAARYPQDDEEAMRLVRKADMAMYQAKERGKNTWVFFCDELDQRMQLRMAVENDLHRAIEQDELRLTYQPVFALDDGGLIGAEVLVRWDHPERGELLPDSFIPVAEECHLIEPLGCWVLEHTCRQLARWRALGLHTRVSVNLSMQQFHNPKLCRQLADLLERYALPADCLVLEITEQAMMRNAEQVIATIRELERIGIKLALDDFGTGHASLSHLHRLPIDYLKVDRSFVVEIGRSTGSEKIILAIIEMAHALGLQVVAEGIEQPAQLVRLREMGCDLIQGHLFYPALDRDTFAALVSA